MVIYCQGLKPVAFETRQAFQVRRARAAGVICRSNGLWADRWLQRAHDWDDHVYRQTMTPMKIIHQWHGEDWLALQRLQWVARKPIARARAWSTTAGRTGTRIAAGCVQPRWHSSVLLQHLPGGRGEQL